MNEETEREQQATQLNIPVPIPTRLAHPLTGREFMEQQYREGKLLNLPKPQPLSPEEQAERERLAQLFAGGKPMSEIVIEGRGPY